MKTLHRLKNLYHSMVVATLLTLSSCTVAANTDQVIERCSSQATVAANIMQARQNGVPITRILEINKEYPDAKSLLDFFAMEAYKVPRYSTPENQQQSIVEFSNTIFMLCMNYFNKTS